MYIYEYGMFVGADSANMNETRIWFILHSYLDCLALFKSDYSSFGHIN